MSIAAPPEASRSITHYRCKKDFFCKIQYGVAEQQVHPLRSLSWIHKGQWIPSALNTVPSLHPDIMTTTLPRLVTVNKPVNLCLGDNKQLSTLQFHNAP